MGIIFEKAKQHIIDTLPDYEGISVYGGDLGHMLTEGQNANGSWYCNTYKAEQDLKEWAFTEDMEEVVSDMKGYESDLFRFFTHPEAFHCEVMICAVDSLVSQLETVSEYWDKQFQIDEVFIEAVIEELKATK